MAQQHLADAFVSGRTLQQHGQQPALGEVADPLGAQVRQARTVLSLQTRMPYKLSDAAAFVDSNAAPWRGDRVAAQATTPGLALNSMWHSLERARQRQCRMPLVSEKAKHWSFCREAYKLCCQVR